jgi:hypothetical protein
VAEVEVGPLLVATALVELVSLLLFLEPPHSTLAAVLVELVVGTLLQLQEVLVVAVQAVGPTLVVRQLIAVTGPLRVPQTLAVAAELPVVATATQDKLVALEL